MPHAVRRQCHLTVDSCIVSNDPRRLRHDQGVSRDVDSPHVEARGQMVIGNLDLGEDILVEGDHRFPTTVTQMADGAKRRVLALLKHPVFSVEPVRCGSGFRIHEDRVCAIHGGGEIHWFRAEVLKDRIEFSSSASSFNSKMISPPPTETR